MAVTITQGTQTGIKTTTDGVNGEIQHVRNDGGTIAVISSISNIGTIKEVTNAGTNVNVVSGSLVGTVVVGTTLGIGTLTNIGSIDTIGTMPAIVVGESTGGTLDELGSVGTIAGLGGVVQVSGTVSTGGAGTQPVAVDTGTITTGSLANIAYIHSIGTMPAIAVGESTGGTLDIVTGVGTLGSISNIAKIHNAGTVAALPTLNLTTGTITTGSITDIAKIYTGTIQSSGTTTGVGVVTNITNVANLAKGTITTGSVSNVAMIHAGTLSSVTMSNTYTGSQVLIAQAVGTTGGTIVGTLSAASGAGTYHWVSGLQIVVGAGTTDVFLGYGTTTTGGSVLARGIFTPGGGIMRDFTFPIRSVGTNSEICYIIAGAGTASIAVNYWKGI